MFQKKSTLVLLVLVIFSISMISGKLVCPVAPEGIVTTCDVKCSGDDECSDGEMCCSYGCQIACMKPVEEPTRKPTRPIPIPLQPRGCPKPSGAGICSELCSISTPCPTGEICCSTGCGHACYKPK